MTTATTTSAPFQPNYDESKVPVYELPAVLSAEDGSLIRDANAWRVRRAELLNLFEEHVYGKMPTTLPDFSVELREESSGALGGNATRKQVRISWGDQPDGPSLNLLLYLPNQHTKPAPLFLGLNFFGNHTIHSDTAIELPTTWVPDMASAGSRDNRASETGRGLHARCWPVEMIVERGYGVATAYCGDLDPDFDDGFQNGIHPLFYHSGQAHPAPDGRGTIGAWAWGLSRSLDYLQTDADVDASRVAVIGHSRLGKAALWAGATDERFALVISNNSGCGGAALSRRRVGETVARINSAFPHWFCANFRAYNDHEDDLPIDQHQLLALVAPRPLYVASASDDLWADPRGEFLALYHARPVYDLLVGESFNATEMPAVDTPITGRVGYHLRSGKHDITPYDWQCYLDFADRNLREG